MLRPKSDSTLVSPARIDAPRIAAIPRRRLGEQRNEVGRRMGLVQLPRRSAAVRPARSGGHHQPVCEQRRRQRETACQGRQRHPETPHRPRGRRAPARLRRRSARISASSARLSALDVLRHQPALCRCRARRVVGGVYGRQELTLLAKTRRFLRDVDFACARPTLGLLPVPPQQLGCAACAMNLEVLCGDCLPGEREIAIGMAPGLLGLARRRVGQHLAQLVPMLQQLSLFHIGNRRLGARGVGHRRRLIEGGEPSLGRAEILLQHVLRATTPRA